MKATAFIHASVDHPNCLGQPSLILEKNGKEHFLDGVIKACAEAPEIEKVVVVTSDASGDDVIASLVQNTYASYTKKVETLRIADSCTYSFRPSKSRLRQANFPYSWYPAWGLWAFEGFKEITNQLKVQNAVIIQADLCVTITPSLISTACNNINNKAIRYVYSNPYRELIGIYVPFAHELMYKYKSKVQDRVINKQRIPLLSDLFRFTSSDNNKTYAAKDRTCYKDNFFALVKKQEYTILRCLQNVVWEDYEQQFKWIKHYLYPNVLEYMEMELVNYCNEACSFCPVSRREVEHHRLDQEVVRSRIIDFAQTGIVLNFSGFGEPLLDEKIAEYIRFAKEQKILSVWLETNGTVLNEEKVDVLIESGLDLLNINANIYLHDRKRLEELIAIIDTAKREKDSVFPLIILQFVVAPWLNKEADEFLQSFEPLVDRLILRSPRDYEEIGLQHKKIDFSPIKRSTCRKITDSLYLKANGNMGICERDLGGLIAAHDVSAKTIGELLNSSIQQDIVKEQNKNIFGETFDKCSSCREWYIPNVHNNFDSIDFSALPLIGEQSFIFAVQSYSLADLEKHEKRLHAILDAFHAALSEFDAVISSYTERLSGEKNANAIIFLSKQTDFLRQRKKKIALLHNKFVQYLIPLGDAYIYHKKFEQGLFLWEYVLKHDPSNTYIQKRLDELLEVIDK